MPIPYIETRTGGWNYELENYDDLFATGTSLRRAYDAIDESVIPDHFDVPWMRIENQGNQGACQGHALSTGIEMCHYWAGGDIVQLSRAMAYYESQRIDGIQGDRGSTLSAGLKLAMQTGVCLESDWPYPSRYDRTRPSTWQNSSYKISGHSPIGSWEDGKKHLAIFGPIHIGIMWGSQIDRRVSENNAILDSYSPGGGGHSVEFLNYRIYDYQGNTLPEPYPELWNSWSERWGYQGRCLVTPRAFNQMINDDRMSVFEGMFGSPHPTIPDPDYGDLE